MKKIMVFLIFVSCLFIIGCKKEEKETGDIQLENNEYAMTYEKEYNNTDYKLSIKSVYEGREYNNTIFSFLVNNEYGMYMFNYNEITNNINVDNYIETITSIDKEYRYYVDNSTIRIIYVIDDSNYLSLSIQSLNDDIDYDHLSYLLDYFDFNIIKK